MDYTNIGLISAVILSYLILLLLCFINKYDIAFYVITGIPIAGSLGLFAYSIYKICKNRYQPITQEEMIL